MLDTLYLLHARISVLESLTAELVAAQPAAGAILKSLEAGLATEHALQITNGTSEEFVAAFREAETQLLHELRLRLRARPGGEQTD